MQGKNAEGYADPTATKALTEVSREEKQVHTLVHLFRDTAALAGFEIVGRIELRHKKSGHRYK